MRRRDFLIGLSLVAAAASPTAGAQQASKIPCLGVLSPGPSWSPQMDGLRAGLQELGYIEGQNIRIESRWADGAFDRLPDLAAELVRLDIDVIVASVTQASLAAKKATTTIPIVMIGVADPVGVGLVASLAHPGGNVTGTSSVAADLVSKQLELLREVAPKVSRVAVLWNPANAVFQALQLRQAAEAGRASGLALQLLEARGPHEFEAAFAAMRREGTHALLVLGDPVFTAHSGTLAELAAKDRVATVGAIRSFADAGGLMAYGASYFHLSRRAAAYVDKILKGTKPADLPVEQPTTFELVVNLKTAKALGIEIPPSLLARTDEVIE